METPEFRDFPENVGKLFLLPVDVICNYCEAVVRDDGKHWCARRHMAHVIENKRTHVCKKSTTTPTS